MNLKITQAPIIKEFNELSKLKKEYEKYKKEIGISYEQGFLNFLKMLSQGKILLNRKKIKVFNDEQCKKCIYKQEYEKNHLKKET